MKKILLISNEVLHYRQKVYNYLWERFLEDGYDFQVLADKVQKVNYELKFKCHEESFSIRKYQKLIGSIKPEMVILFLHLKDKIMLSIIAYCRMHGIKVIFWNIGINQRTPNAWLKNSLFHAIHRSCDALITYTPDTRRFFPKDCSHKLFVAYNTLNLTDIDKSCYDKDETRKKYGIKEKRVILYISRMLPYKRVDLLMELFKDLEDIAVVIVGPGFTEQQKAFCNEHDNLYYLGEKYGDEVNEVYCMGDIFSTPGHIGLAMCESLFWGLPVVLLKGKHAPEIYYMKDGVTGYLADGEEDFKNYVIDLLRDDERLKTMSEACLKEYREECGIDNMYRGFLEAVEYCEKG